MKDGIGAVGFKLLDSKDEKWKLFQSALDARRKKLIAMGKGQNPQEKSPISPDEEELLWDKNIFNDSTAKGLLNIVYFYNCKVFGFRATDEHENLMTDQYVFGTANGKQCVTYHERLSKTVNGQYSTKAKPKA